jgi:hypothetical protein
MQEIARAGVKDLTLAVSSLFPVHAPTGGDAQDPHGDADARWAGACH